MPPKKAKLKVRKTSKSAGTKQGVKINIHIDQSKKTRGGAPKPSVARPTLPAFSAIPQGPSYIGAQQPIPQPSASDVGKEVYNHLLMENMKRNQLAYGFGGFQPVNEQTNQLFDGEYRAGRYGQPIILPPSESNSTRAINYSVFDDPETNSIMESNKLSNRGSVLPTIGENSIVELRAEERRDNDLDNLVLHEKKTAIDKDVSRALDENLDEEYEEGITTVEKVGSSIVGGGAPPSSKPSISRLSPAIMSEIYNQYPSFRERPTSRQVQVLRDYLNMINSYLVDKYPTTGGKEELNKNITSALKDAYNIRR